MLKSTGISRDVARIIPVPPTKLRISYCKPWIGELEAAYLREAFDSTWISGGPFIERFERLLRQTMGASHVVAVSNCSAALHMSLLAAGVGPGDEVIMPAFTFASMASATVLAGAAPCFVDSLPDSLGISPEGIRRALTKKTKAVVVFHPFGHCCEMDPIAEIARKHGLALIEDGAQAFGTRYHEAHVGTIGDFGCFSFQSAKTIATGEGGAIIVKDEQKADWARMFRDHGFLPGHNYWHDIVGLNYRMANLQAAIGCAQLERWSEIRSAREVVAREYAVRLRELKGIRVPVSPAASLPHLWVQPVVLDENVYHEGCVDVRQKLACEGIETRPFFSPLYWMPPFSHFATDCPVAEKVSRWGLSLPFFAEMTSADIALVCDALARSVP